MRSEILTRETLLLRLRNKEDDESWAEFAEIYTPLLYGYCTRRGLKHDDACDVVQDVMRSISLAMANFEYDPTKGKFKGWLFTAVRNTISMHFRKQSRRPVTVAETTGLFESLKASPDDAERLQWDIDYQRQLIAWAIEKIRPEFATRIWRAFEATTIEDHSPAEVSAELAMSRNAIGVAKHRVLKRLREKVQSIDAGRWEQEMIERKKKAES